MKEIREKLESLQESIEDAEKTVAQLKGREEESLRRLKDEEGLRSVGEAERWLSKAIDDTDKLESAIKEKFSNLEKSFSW